MWLGRVVSARGESGSGEGADGTCTGGERAHRSWMSPSLVRSCAVSACPAVVTANHESSSRRPDDASPTAAGVTGLRGATPAAAAARDCGGSAPDVADGCSMTSSRDSRKSTRRAATPSGHAWLSVSNCTPGRPHALCRDGWRGEAGQGDGA